jgi:uncharacterized protein (DUF2236 family)
MELYDGCIAPLPLPCRARYQVEMPRFGLLLGVPEELLPRSYSEFKDYVRGMDQDAVLEVGPEARDLAEQVLAPDAGGLPWPLSDTAGRLSRILAAGLLPPRLRAGYRLSWGWREQRTFGTFCQTSRAVVPVLPAQVRYWPHYLSAESRLRQRRPPPRSSTC